MMYKRPLFFAFLVLCLGIWIFSAFHIPFLFEEIIPANHIKNFTPVEPVNVYITAKIVTDTVVREASYNRRKITFTVEAVALRECRGERSFAPTPICGFINVTSYDDRDIGLEYGDYILIKGSLSRFHGLNNPGCFNYSQYLARQGIYSVITVKKGDFISVVEKNKANHFIRSILRLKHRLINYIRKYLPTAEAGILNGILLGDKTGIENDLKDSFIKTGTVHVLVISGLNVGLIVFIFVIILKFMRLPYYIANPTAAVLVVIYTILTGADTPVVRAAIMAVIVLMGTTFNRKIDILNCLGLAGIVVLLKNPQSLFDVGFQLSFVTIISIVIFAPKFEEQLCRGEWLPRYLKQSIAVSLAAWIGIIPIIAYNFNMISPVCIIANIPIVFLLGIATAAGLAFLGAGFIAPFLSSIFAAALEFLISVSIKIVVLFSKIPFGFFWVHRWNFAEIISFYAVLAVFGLSMYKKNFSKAYLIIALLLFLNIFTWASMPQVSNYQLRVTVLDVGHGDAILLEFPDNSCALIDTGKKSDAVDMGEDVIAPFLRSKRIGSLDAVFITHSDDDHAGCLKSIVKDFKVRNVFDSNNLKFQDKITGFKGAQILILNPQENKFFGTESDTNNNSLVIKVIVGRRSLIFCGDIREDAMQKMLAFGQYLESDVIKIPHHGSGFGPGSESFIRAVKPRIAVISGAQRDVSGSLLELLRSINCQIYKTYTDGAITIIIKNDDINAQNFSCNSE